MKVYNCIFVRILDKMVIIKNKIKKTKVLMLLYIPLMWYCNVQQMLHLSMILNGDHPEILCGTF